MPPPEFRYQAPSKSKPKAKAAIKPDSEGPDRGEAALDASWNADTVRALRRHLGFTQQEMAEHLGTRQQTISEWERGLYAPRGASKTLLGLVAERSNFRYVAAPETR